jgi:hypothetical protein
MANREFDLIDKTFTALAERKEKLGEENVDEIGRVVLLIWHASGIIGNGGIRYFFECNLSLSETAKAYEQIGVEKAALILRKILNLFPNHSVPDDWDERMVIVDKLYDQNAELFHKLEREYYATDGLMEKQLAGWIRVHSDVFENLKNGSQES